MDTTQTAPTDRDFVPATLDLVKATSQELTLVTCGVYLIWQVAAAAGRSPEYGMRAAPSMVTAAVAGGLALWLLPRRLLAAQVIWLAGLASTLVLHEALLGQREAAMLYTLIPLAAVLTIGRWAGLAATFGVLALIATRVYIGFPLPLDATLGVPIAIGAVLTAFIGWNATRSLLTVTRWSLFYFDQARRRVEEARDQRMELKQVQEDLLQANRELTRLSERLKGLNQLAEDARRTKEEFVANVSHELRTPLNMIIGFSDMLLRSSEVYGTRLPPRVLADIAAIERNSHHLSRLVDDVLDLSQADSGRLTLDRQWTELPELVGGACEVVRGLFDAKQLELRIDRPPEVRPVFCDSTRIRQVLINLLSNAGRFTERGGVTLRIAQGSGVVTLAVADTGPGIAPEDQQRLFEPFQQLDSSIRRRYGGSGLGLAISKRLVELHGGMMWLESQPGVGTTFYFSLPVDPAQPVAVVRADDALRWFDPHTEYEYRSRTRPFRAPAPELPPRYVVLEEGNTLQQMLQRHMGEVEIVHVPDMAGAVTALNQAPALALIVNAPPLEVLREDRTVSPASLRQLPYATPAIICWAPGEMDAARRMGVVHYLVKPITRDALVGSVAELGPQCHTVLIVDDDQEVLQLFSRMLSTAGVGYRVLRARNGQQALAIMRERHPDAVLLDLMMPGMDGYQVLHEKSQDPAIQSIPVIVTSSRDPGGPMVADVLAITRGGGLSMRDLAISIQMLSAKLAPTQSPAGLAPPGNLAA